MAASNTGFLRQFGALCLILSFSSFVSACDGVGSSLKILGGMGICRPELLGYVATGVNNSDHEFAGMINEAAVLEDVSEPASGM